LGDTAFMYDILAIAAKRQSIEIADNLGLTIKMESATQKLHPSLATLAGRYEDLTDQQKFLNEMLIQGDRLLVQAGINADNATDSYNGLSAAWGDLTKGMDEAVNKKFGGIVGGFENLLRGIADNVLAENTLKRAIDDGIISKEEAGEQINKLTWTSYTAADALEWLAAKQKGLTVEQWNAVQAGMAVDATLSGESVRMGLLGKSALNAMAEVGGLKQSLLDLQGVYTAIIRVVTQNVSAGFLENNPELRTGMTYLTNQNPGMLQYEMGDNWRPDYQLPQINYSSGGGYGGGGAGGGMAQAAPPPWEAPMSVASAMGSLASIAMRRYEESIIDPLKEAVDVSDDQIEKQQKLIDMLRAMPKDIGVKNALLTAQERMTELEQERLEAAKKLADEQERILRIQKQQENLDFLQAQIRLLDMISEHGLNAGDILGGLQLGLEADMGEILDAMSTAMQELITQAEDTLGIASPSKVFQGIGQNIVKGLAIGMDAPNTFDAAVSNLFGNVGIAGIAPSAIAPSGGGSLQISMDVNSKLDIEELAYRVAEVIRSKTR